MSAHDRVASERELGYCYEAARLPTEMIRLAALRSRFPEFVFFVTFVHGRRCYQAERVRGDGPLLSVSCVGAIELWRVLNCVHGWPGPAGSRTHRGQTRRP